LNKRLRLILILAAVAATTVVVPPLVLGGRDDPNGGPRGADNKAVPTPALTGSVAGTTPPPSGRLSPTVETLFFEPIIVEAEGPTSVLSGGSKILHCDACGGGHRVGYLGGAARVVARIVVPTAGERTVTVTYTTDGPRTLKLDVNGNRAHMRLVTGPDWETPRLLSFTSYIPAGVVLVALYNDESPAPDIDSFVIS
jgi:hypothetical protein